MKKLAGVAAIAAASLFLVSACGGEGGDSSEGGTVKIGVVLPLTGPQESIAKYEAWGAEAAAKEINDAGGIAGKWKVELVTADDQLDTSMSATVMRDLQAAGVGVAIGGQTTDLCKSAAEAAERSGILFLGSHCVSSALVDPKPVTPNFYMLAQRDVDLTAANGRALAKVFPDLEMWDVFSYDYETARAFWAQTAAGIETGGGATNTNTELFIPVTATDMQNQLQALVSGQKGAKDSRGLFLGIYGGGLTTFIQQARPLGILDDYKVMAMTGVYWATAKSLQGEAPPIHDVYEYFWGCQDNPVNDKFIESFKDASGGVMPDTGAYQAYMSVKMLAAAAEKAGSTETKAIQGALPGLTIDTPTGLPMTMNGDTHHVDGAITTAVVYGDKNQPDGIGMRDCNTVLASELS